MYAYIDESGDTGYTKKSTKYFILTAVVVEDPFVLRRIVKNIHKGKRDKKKANILHTHSETNQTKDKLTESLIGNEVHCIVSIVKKAEETVADIYLLTLRKMTNHLKSLQFKSFVIARRDTRKYYNQSIIDDILGNYNIEIIFSDMLSEKALQISDFYSWCVFAHLEHGNSDYYSRLSSQIVFI